MYMYVVCTLSAKPENQSFDPVRPCAGLHIRSGSAPRCPELSHKKRFSVIACLHDDDDDDEVKANANALLKMSAM